MARRLTLLLLAAAAAASTSAVPQGPPHEAGQATAPEPPAARIRPLPAPADFYAMALADARTLDETTRKYTRYVAHRKPTLEAKTTSLVLNYASRAGLIARPRQVADGALVAVDLRRYAPLAQDQAEWLALWEEFAFDPTFSLLVTRDTLDLAKDLLKDAPDVFTRKVRRVVRTSRPDRVVTLPSGETVSIPRKPLETVVEEEVILFDQVNGKNPVDAVRLNAPHLGAAQAELQSLLGTQAPVVDHRYLKHRLVNTIKDRGVYAAVWGGRYYEFAGVRRAADVLGKATQATDLDLFFEGLGIGNIVGKEGKDRLFDRLRSDQRALIFHSLVTGKPRVVESFNVPAARNGSAWGAITDDVADADVDAGDRPWRNLLRPRFKAREAIFPRRNGLLTFALFNAQGARQDEVPPDIAHDTTIPGAHTKRLQTRGCIVCHGVEGSDGWKACPNDARRLISRQLDVFDDRADAVRFTPDVIDRLAGLYAGTFDKPIRRSRDDLAEATLRATGPWPGGDGSQADAAKQAAVQLQKDLDGYWYAPVDARAALADEGFDVPADRAPAVFNDLHPPELAEQVGGVVLEDPTIGALRNGLTVSRSDWSLSYSFAMGRSLRSPARQRILAEAMKP